MGAFLIFGWHYPLPFDDYVAKGGLKTLCRFVFKFGPKIENGRRSCVVLNRRSTTRRSSFIPATTDGSHPISPDPSSGRSQRHLLSEFRQESFERIRGRYPGESDGDSVSGSTHGMDGFFKQVAEVEKLIDKINTQVDKLQAASHECQQVTKASAMKALKEQMEKDVEEVSRTALKVKASVEALDRDNLASRKKPGCQKGTGVDRSRTSMTLALKKKLKERMSQFQSLRQTIHAEYRELVERRVFTVTGVRPDEETIDHLIETGNGEQIFANAIQGYGRGQIVDTLEEIQERRDTCLELEKKLLDLQQMFMDMAVLVEVQGELLNDIESQVTSSVDHVQKATVQLQQAKKIQKNSRKWMFFAIILLLVILAAAIYPILKDSKKEG